MLRELTATWIRLLAHIWRLFRARMAFLLSVAVLTGLVDGVAMALLLPLLSLIGIGSGADNVFAASVGRAFRLIGVPLTLESALAVPLVLFALQGALVILQGHMVAKIEAAYVSHWREQLLRRLLGASWPYFSSHQTGGLVYLLVTEAERLGRAFFLTVQLVAVLAVAVAYVVLSLAISWTFTVILFLSLAVLAAIFFGFSSGTSYSLARDYGTFLGELQATVTEFLTGAKLIKATAAEPFVLERVRPIQARIERSYFGGVVIPYVLKSVMEISAIVLFCALIYVGVRMLHVRPAVLLVLLAIFFRLVPKLHTAQYNLQQLLTYLPAFQRLERACRDIDAMSEPYAIDSREQGFSSAPSITMDDVTVTYDERDVLSRVSLCIPARTTLGVVGVSGAGKSTLVDCLVGLAVPRTGTITLDGTPLTDVNLRQWRSSIGYVAQDTVLFSGTVREIVCQGREITDQQMIAAASQAHALGFIHELPNGFDTVVGSAGVQLSGGQRQRLSLARALAGRPVMLILDEPTSNLDSSSEKEIFAALSELHGKITVVVVSHRLAMVQDADSIVVLDKGRIVGEGESPALAGSSC